MRDPTTILDESMGLLEANIRLLAEKMKRGDSDKEPAFNERDAAHAQRLARSAAALGAEVRKHQGDIETAAKKTTVERRAEIAEKWLGKLPRDLLRAAVERLVTHLKEKS
jgi:hypothetical protein